MNQELERLFAVLGCRVGVDPPLEGTERQKTVLEPHTRRRMGRRILIPKVGPERRSRGGGLPRRDSRPCACEAYVPDPLVGRRIMFDGEVAADVADAEAAGPLGVPFILRPLGPWSLAAWHCRSGQDSSGIATAGWGPAGLRPLPPGPEGPAVGLSGGPATAGLRWSWPAG